MTFAAKILLPLVSIAAVAASAEQPGNLIGTIDFFGYGSLDPARLERVLPFKPGDPLPAAELRDEAEQTISRVVDRPSVTISSICCLADGRFAVFVGMAEASSPYIDFNERPSGDHKFPAAILDVFRKMDQYWQAAVLAGHAAEDDSQGYALLDDPDTHFQQIKLRDWARANFQVVFKILDSSRYQEQRAYRGPGNSPQLPPELPDQHLIRKEEGDDSGGDRSGMVSSRVVLGQHRHGQDDEQD